MLIGIDAAHWQGVLPADQLFGAGVRFAIIKATHGLGLNPDAQFLRSWRALLGFPIVRGAYHWLTDADPVKQGEHFVRVVEAAGYNDDDLPLAVDFEEPSTRFRGRELLDHMRACVYTVEDKTGRPVIMYTGRWYWQQFVGDLDAQDVVERCLYWHAEYPRTEIRDRRACGYDPPTLPAPRLSKPWADRGLPYFMHQFDGNGGCVLPNGVDADFNRFEGSLADLREVCARRVGPMPSADPVTVPGTPTSKSSQRIRAVDAPIVEHPRDGNVKPLFEQLEGEKTYDPGEPDPAA